MATSIGTIHRNYSAAGCSRSRPTAFRKASVLVRASSELKRPELKRPAPPKLAEPPKRPAEPVATAPAAVAAPPAQGHAAIAAPLQHSPPPAAAPAPTIASPSKVVTVEYQRMRAKEMTKYFQNLKLAESIQKAQVFGWTPANEISNGRWVMFGFAVGLLTEYATGVDFPDQFKLMVSYLGLADLD
ncbi:hypothetical protein V8C86DRAFT_2467830 [Haematococcus lacustris]